MTNIFSDAIFPDCCPTCLSTVDVDGLCRNCLSSITPLGPSCYKCLTPIAQHDKNICAHCAAGVPFDQVLALTRYIPPISDLICRLKYQRHIYLAKVLGTLLASHIKKHCRTLPELLITVPLHKQRIRQRRFNQAVEIARTVSAQLNLKTDYQCVEKTKMTPLQTTLTARQRRQNLKGAFRLRYPIHAQSVAILDDVMTTGTTVSEIASLLKANGVSRVEIWTLART